jgi:hypothetical protein
VDFNRWRLLAALVVLPIFDACLGYAIGSTIWRPPGYSASGNANMGIALAGIAGFWGLLVTITAVLPVVFWLAKRGPLTLERLVLTGAALGNLPLAVVAAFTVAFALGHLAAGTLSEHLSPPLELLVATFRILLLGSFMGAASGALFWLVALSGRQRA